MINYIYCNFLKPKDFTTTEMHLFEHCYYNKLLKIINKNFKNEGFVYDASTSLSNVLIETNEESRKYFEKESIKYKAIDTETIEKQKQGFILFLYLNDPYLREFNKFYVSSTFIKENLSIEEIVNIIKQIKSDCILDIIKSGVLC
ncbi:MAG: hypothetical protein FWF57_07195 [Defluviitaleaceae bacterium]|nr:hypothetical protein [Defluviitaleaceae bacterium]